MISRRISFPHVLLALATAALVVVLGVVAGSAPADAGIPRVVPAGPCAIATAVVDGLRTQVDAATAAAQLRDPGNVTTAEITRLTGLLGDTTPGVDGLTVGQNAAATLTLVRTALNLTAQLTIALGDQAAVCTVTTTPAPTPTVTPTPAPTSTPTTVTAPPSVIVLPRLPATSSVRSVLPIGAADTGA